MRLLIIAFSSSAGTQTVLRNLVPHFAQRCEKVVYCGSAIPDASGTNLHPYSFGTIAGRFLQFHERILNRIGSRSIKKALFWRTLRRLVDHEAITHVFYPWAVGERIRSLGVPSGAMVMDTLWRVFPEEFPDPEEMDASLEHNLQTVDWIFPISHFTEQAIREAYAIPEEHIRTVPHGANPHLASSRKRSPRAADSIPFFLYPAHTTANKNHLCLFEAARILHEQGVQAKIMLTSRAIDRLRDSDNHIGYRARLKNWLKQHPEVVDAMLDLRGEVSWEELNNLYNECHAVVLPSLYEGFGLPLVEAFERNAPVICSDIPPFREQIARYRMENLSTLVEVASPSTLAAALSATIQTEPDKLPGFNQTCERLSCWTWYNAAEAYRTALM